MTYRELVYIVLDEIKQISDDSIITEDHVKFLANLYRYFLLYNKKQKEGTTSLSTSNQLTICVNLELVNSLPNVDVCTNIYLKSELEIPDLMDNDNVSVASLDMFGTNIAYVSRERFKYVGHNKWLKNIIYCCLGPDHHLYLKGFDASFKYLKLLLLTGVFEDSDKANEMACDKNSEGSSCDPLDKEFPIDGELVPLLIELLVKELSAVAWRQKENRNDDVDDLADLMTYIRLNSKSALQKRIENGV